MTSLFDLDNSSDSEDDFDYVPPSCELSSDDEPLLSSDDEKDKKRNRERSSKTVLETEKVSVDEIKQVTDTKEEKKKADDVYKCFLDEIAAEMKDSRAQNEPVTSGISYSESTTSSSVVLGTEKKPMSLSPEPSSVSTTEKLFEFAGETVSVVDGTVKPVESDSSSVSSESEKAAPAAEATASPLVKRKGLESVLGAIQNKKQKITVMEKSMLDWKTFKKQEGLNEELEQFNRGKGGFIERQRFLERSDVRSYEIERDMRVSKRHTQPKRDT